MDINKKFDKQKKNIDFINEGISKLIEEQAPGISKKTASAIDNLISLAKQMSDTSTYGSDDIRNTGGKIMLRHGEIKFKDSDDTTIGEKKSAGYKISDVNDLGDKTILTLKGGDDNKLIPKDLILYITIPYSEGVNYRDDFEAKLEQKNIKTDEKDDLDDVIMRIIKFESV